MESNIPLIILWVVCILIGIFFIGGIIYVVIYKTNDGNSSVVTNTVQCSDLTSDLPDISDEPFCVGQGNTKYNDDINVIMGPVSISYQAVCKEFCSGNYDTDTDICSNDTQININLVNNCLAAMKPVNCEGQAMPLAISNGTSYYGNRASLTRC